MTPLFAASIYWHLPILLVVFSLVYSATRHDRWDRILWEAAGWGVRVGGFLLGVGVLLFAASSAPKLAPYLAGVFAVGFAVYYVLVGRRHKPAETSQPSRPGR